MDNFLQNYKNDKFVKLLIQNQDSVTIQKLFDLGYVPINFSKLLSYIYSNTEILKIFFDHGLDPYTKVSIKYNKKFRYSTDLDTDAYLKYEEHVSLMDLAIDTNKINIIKLLQNYGVRMEKKLDFDFFINLSFTQEELEKIYFCACLQCFEKTIEYFITELKFSPNYKFPKSYYNLFCKDDNSIFDCTNYTPLHLVIISSSYHKSVLTTLLKLGADPFCNTTGISPYSISFNYRGQSKHKVVIDEFFKNKQIF